MASLEGLKAPRPAFVDPLHPSLLPSDTRRHPRGCEGEGWGEGEGEGEGGGESGGEGGGETEYG